MKEQIYVFPADQDTNWSISKHPSMVQVEPDWNAECFVGDNPIELPVYPVPNLLFKSIRNNPGMAFYAFIQKGKGRKQFFYSRGVNKKSVVNESELSVIVSKMVDEHNAKKKEDKKAGKEKV